MSKIFRKIRFSSLRRGRIGRYMAYALGEIVLVVVGILIALQINDYYAVQKEQQRELGLLKELKSNLEVNIANLNKDIEAQKIGYRSIQQILAFEGGGIPYNDSLPYHLAEANYAPDVVLTASAFETLKSEGLGLIKDDSLRQAIITLFEVDYPTLMQETKRLEDQLWPTAVTPLYQKHFRSENNLWIPTDFEAWVKDSEFFNMLSFRGALRNQSTYMKTDSAKKTKEIIELIEKRLSKGS